MVGAYFDNNGFQDIYTGPANGGMMPTNEEEAWPHWTDGIGDEYPGNPLVASRNGLDGRTTKGSIDDYWASYESAALDPYITGMWTQHTWGDAFGDYMKTSQSAYENKDGSTRFNWWQDGSRLTCDQMETAGLSARDGTYGRKLFYEARGYSVGDCYSQLTDNQRAGGFSFADYKAEINAGRPVLLNLVGHTVVGIGYADPSTVYLNDTWDHNTHSMTWGGTYSMDPPMALNSVSVVTLEGASPPKPAITGLNPPSATPGGPAFTLTVNGTNFVNGSVVRWNGSNRATTYVSSTQLTASITAADIAAPGTASITVLNPAPGGGVSNAISFAVGALRRITLPLIRKDPPPAGPRPGYWRDDQFLEFYVTSDGKYVDDFAIYISGDCGDYIITHVVPEPISGNAFSFSGPFYGSGTFTSPTAADVTAGLSNFYIKDCGFISGGPWPTNATWRYAATAAAAPPSGGAPQGGGAPRGGADIDVAQPATGMPGMEVTRVK